MSHDSPPSPWKILEEHIYEEFRLFTIRRSTRVNPRTGKPFSFFLMSGLDWVNVIPLTEQGEVVFVRQLRHGSGEVTLEIPGGAVETNEDPSEAARRELLEETGYEPSEIAPIGSLYANPAMQSMKCTTFLARGCRITRAPQLDPGEDMEVLTMPLQEALAKVRSGEISHALVVAAFAHLVLSERL